MVPQQLLWHHTASIPGKVLTCILLRHVLDHLLRYQRRAIDRVLSFWVTVEGFHEFGRGAVWSLQ